MRALIFYVIHLFLEVIMIKTIQLNLVETAVDIRYFMEYYKVGVKYEDETEIVNDDYIILVLIVEALIKNIGYIIDLHKHPCIRSDIKRPDLPTGLFGYYLNNDRQILNSEPYLILKNKLYRILGESEWDLWELRKQGVVYNLHCLGDFRLRDWKDRFYRDGIYYPDGVPKKKKSAEIDEFLNTGEMKEDD